VNMHFGKSVPNLLNDERVKDAQMLLIETQAAIKIIAQEAGFNSIASFNRVFKDITGSSPSEFRKKNAA
ncbi:MAG: helix-turn-helix transcriptional regulator, partial [Pseudomonadota bacterium]